MRQIPESGEDGYLLVARLHYHKRALEEYKGRWQIETMFGCLKKRGFNFEETHLTMPLKIAKLLQSSSGQAGQLITTVYRTTVVCLDKLTRFLSPQLSNRFGH